MKYLFTLLLLAYGSFGRAQFDHVVFLPLKALQGTWHMPVKNGVLYERWEVANDSLLTGESYKIIQGDTIPQEKMTLYFHQGKIVYTPVTAHQNQQLPVDFTLVSAEGGVYVFENKAHDFPQQISYQVVSDSELMASISGNTKSGFKSIPYGYKKLAMQ